MFWPGMVETLSIRLEVKKENANKKSKAGKQEFYCFSKKKQKQPVFIFTFLLYKWYLEINSFKYVINCRFYIIYLFLIFVFTY